ncbi:MAG: PEP-CTERM sorting domain-containing protein [Verrucomicrobiota bacterium]
MKSCLKYLTALSMLSTASAQTAVWEGTGTAVTEGRYWGELANWSGVADAPIGSARSISFNNDGNTAAGQRIPLLADASGNDTSITIGNISFSTASGNRGYSIRNVTGGNGELILDSGAGGTPVSISAYTSASNVHSIDANVQLNSDLELNIRGTSSSSTSNIFVVNGSISGAGGIFSNASNNYRTLFNGANTYTGNTTLTNGQFVVGATGTLGNSDTFVSTAATLILESNAALNDTSNLTLQSGSILQLDFTGTDSVAGITIAGSTLAAGTYDATALSGFGVSATGTGSFTIAAIPEPSTAALLVGLSAVGLALARRDGRKD